MLVLRGLPFSATSADVAYLVQKAGATANLAASPRAIALLQDASGRPSGFCAVRLSCAAVLQEVQRKLHMQRLGTRYIEALLPGRCERWVSTAVANIIRGDSKADSNETSGRQRRLR